MAGYRPVVNLHPLTHFTLQLSITTDGLRTVHVTTAVKFTKATVCHSDRVIFVEVVTKPCLSKHRGKPYRIWGSLVDVDGLVVEKKIGRKSWVFRIMVIVERTCAKYLQPAATVSYGEIIVISPPFVVLPIGICLYAQSVVLPLDGLNADDCIDLCIVLRTRRCDDIHTLDV